MCSMLWFFFYFEETLLATNKPKKKMTKLSQFFSFVSIQILVILKTEFHIIKNHIGVP